MLTKHEMLADRKLMIKDICPNLNKGRSDQFWYTNE